MTASKTEERFESETVGEPVPAPPATAKYGLREDGRGFGCMPCGYRDSRNTYIVGVDNEGRYIWS